VKNHNQNSQKQKKLGACSRRTYIAHGLFRNFREKSVTCTPFLLNFLENKCDTSTKLTQSLWQVYMYVAYGRNVFPIIILTRQKAGPDNHTTTYFLFSRSRQEGRPWGASTGGLVHTAARIKRTEGRGRSSLSARYKAMRTSRSNQYRLWH